MLHEAIVTRNAIRRADEFHLIDVVENIAPVCFGCNPESGRGGPETGVKVASKIVSIVGKKSVLEWLNSLEKHKPSIAREAILLVENI